MKQINQIFLGGLLLVVATTMARAQFTYITNNGTITITGYTGSGGSVVIPSATNGLPVTSIGTNAFADSELGSVTIPGSVTNIGDYAFLNCFSLSTVNLAQGLILIGNDAFADCNDISALTIPSTVTSIGDYAFYELANLGNITIPNSVTHIGTEAFEDTYLGTVTLPASVTNLGGNPFGLCSRLTAITVATNNTAYTNVGGILFNKNQTALIGYPEGLSTASYVIPNTVTVIGAYAFGGCTTFTNIVIPPSVTTIGDSAFYDCLRLPNISIPASVQAIGDSPFGYCSGLTTISVDTNNPAYLSPGGVLFDTAQTTLIAYPASNPTNAYSIPNTVTKIGDYAFSKNVALGSITIPSNVISLGNFAFYSSGGLTNVSIANGLGSIGFLAFYNCTKLKNVNLPDSISSIGYSAFDSCTALRSVTIPASITNFGLGIFGNCSGLTNVIIEDGLTSIGENMLDYCYSLRKVTIPASVANIGAYAFSLDSLGLYFEGAPPTAGQFALNGSITAYYLPNATGWGTNYAGRPTAIWQPAILTTDGSFGLRIGEFGFNISWASNYSVTVSANNDLTTTNWTALQSCTLTNGTFYFSDATANAGQKFYRLSWP